jgi:hypothetical protein
MDLEQARRLRDNADFQTFMGVIKEDIEALKEDMLGDTFKDTLPEVRAMILAIRRVTGRLDNLIDELEEHEASARNQG